MNKKKVLFLTNLRAPYRVEFFNQLSELVDLTVAFEQDKTDDRDDNWYNNNKTKYRDISLTKIRLRKVVHDKYDLIFNCDYSSKYGVELLFIAKIKKIPIVLVADGGIFINRGTVVNKGISIVMKLHDYYFSSSEFTDKYFNSYGIKKNITHFHFSSLTKAEISTCKRKEHTGINILSIGRMIDLKRFDTILKATKDLNINVTIVGGKPLESLLNINSKAIFIDFVSKDELQHYFELADIFVLASDYEMWGLVLNEAIAYNIPIISSDMCVAGLEFVNNYNAGLLFETANYLDLKNKILSIIQDDKLAQLYASNCELVNEKYNIEEMVKDHYDFINNLKC